METEEIRQITIDDLAQSVAIDYVDGDIAFSDRINYHSPRPSSFKIEALRILACMKGSLQVVVNSREYIITANELFCCGPNAVIHHCQPSIDFECKMLALSTRVVRRFINHGSDMRNKIYYVNQNPILRIGEEGMQVFNQYHALLYSRIKVAESRYRKDIVSSLTGAILYELLASLDKFCAPVDNTLVRQGDILFKRFIEILAGTQIKSRNVSYYADKLFVTPKYLSTVCKQVSEKTAFDLINQLVMEDITQLLKYSEKSIKEISDYLDFPTLSFFGKYVKAHSGFSPTEYRRQLNMRS